VEVKGHSRSEEPEEIPVRSAECERNGYVYLFYRRSNCGESLHRQLKSILPIDHEWGDWEFFDENQHQKVCSRDPLHTHKENHSWNEGEVIKEATAGSEGSCKYQCTVCGMTRTEITPPTEHNHGLTHVVARDATCTEDGVSREYWICDQGEYACGIAFSDADATIEINPEEYVIPALGHDWGDWKVTKEATEKTAGLKTRECGRCHATLTEKLEKKTATAKVSGKQTAKMTAKGKKSLTISWNKIQGADGYDIFFAKCKKKTACKKIKTIKGNKTFKWTKPGLKKGTSYKAYVKAYVMKNGKKSYVNTSPMIHAYAGNIKGKYTNARSVILKNVKKGKLSLKKGKTFKIKAKVTKVKKNKKLMPGKHVKTVRYMTSNKNVATVSKSGKITAKGNGTCTITVYAHNGVSKSINVTVK